MQGSSLTSVVFECRRAVRGLIHAPGFAIGVVLVLGIAIAGTVTVATAAHALFLRPLPFAHPDRLVEITAQSRSMGFEGFSVPMLGHMRKEPMLLDVAAYEGADAVTSPAGDTWQRALVTHNLARVLGVRPVAGRAFVAADAEPGAAPVALISESVWRNRFGAAESAIGSEVIIEEKRVTVIGVMPGGFTIPSPATQLWQPLTYAPEEFGPGGIGSFTGGHLIARLEPGVTAVELQHALRARFASDAPLRVRRIRELMGVEVVVRGLREAWTAEQRQPLAIVGLASMLVLCHVLADGARLLVPGLAAGMFGAWVAGRMVVNRLYEVSPVDPVTWIGVGLLLALVVLVAGLWPAERAARVQPTEALRHE